MSSVNSTCLKQTEQRIPSVAPFSAVYIKVYGVGKPIVSGKKQRFHSLCRRIMPNIYFSNIIDGESFPS
jgi:hypothetical protein